jgi:hypothetical protein
VDDSANATARNGGPIIAWSPCGSVATRCSSRPGSGLPGVDMRCLPTPAANLLRMLPSDR